jgi:hypothetical protein
LRGPCVAGSSQDGTDSHDSCRIPEFPGDPA